MTVFYVNFTAYGVPHRAEFEFQQKAEAFADDMADAGYENVEVHNELDPRRIVDHPDSSAEIIEIDPVYEPEVDHEP